MKLSDSFFPRDYEKRGIWEVRSSHPDRQTYPQTKRRLPLCSGPGFLVFAPGFLVFAPGFLAVRPRFLVFNDTSICFYLVKWGMNLEYRI